MASAQPAFKGLTPPISQNLPTPAELAANDALIEELKRQNNFESPEETARRTKILQLLQKVTVAFVKEVMTKKGKFSQAVIGAAGGKIFTFGSYRLGVYGPGSDIDTLVVVPKQVTREDFFEHFPGVLERMSNPGAIEEMTPVPDAFVPIIKLEYSGISIDLLIASIASLSSVPLNLDLRDNTLLRGLDDPTLRAVNGTRVTDEMLELVPQQKTFRTALRAIKLWAKKRGTYGNIVGFPGGVAWAMLVARTCQLYPNATGAIIVWKFFRIIGKWRWPDPVQLNNIETGSLRTWNPSIYRGDQSHLMPIITPAYPAMCATHNVTVSTKSVILKEMERGGQIVEKIFAGQLGWEALFERHTYFTKDYKYYLSIVATSRTKETQHIWSGLVESKVRTLVGDLDYDELIKVAHPYIKGFERMHHCHSDEELEAVKKGDLRYQAPNTTKTTDSTNDPKHNAVADAEGAIQLATTDSVNGTAAETVATEAVAAETATAEKATDNTLYTTTYYIGLELNEGAKQLNVSWQINKFRDLCHQWLSFDEEKMYLHVLHTKNVDLPDDVFDPGEIKPQRTSRKKGLKQAKKDSTTNGDTDEPKKRKLEEDHATYNGRPHTTKKQSSGLGTTVESAV